MRVRSRRRDRVRDHRKSPETRGGEKSSGKSKSERVRPSSSRFRRQVSSSVAGGLSERYVHKIGGCAVVDDVSGHEGHCNGRGWGVKDALERSEVPTAKWRLDFLCGFPVIRDVLEMEGQLLALHGAVMPRTRDPQHGHICPSCAPR